MQVNKTKRHGITNTKQNNSNKTPTQINGMAGITNGNGFHLKNKWIS